MKKITANLLLRLEYQIMGLNENENKNENIVLLACKRKIAHCKKAETSFKQLRTLMTRHNVLVY
jgi:hypothetical protein